MSIFRQIFNALVRLYLKLREYRNLSRSRKALMHLSDAMLRDIGISRKQAIQQASLPFWKKSHGTKLACEGKPKARLNKLLGLGK